MKDTKSRLFQFSNALFHVTCGLVLAIFLISYLRPLPQTTASMKILRFEARQGYNIFIFETSVDLNRHFRSNTKQILLYLNCTRTDGTTEVVWTKTVQKGDTYAIFSKERANISLRILRGEKCHFELLGNVYPYTGPMRKVSYCKFNGIAN